jgi:hypothetical protein
MAERGGVRSDTQWRNTDLSAWRDIFIDLHQSGDHDRRAQQGLAGGGRRLREIKASRRPSSRLPISEIGKSSRERSNRSRG